MDGVDAPSLLHVGIPTWQEDIFSDLRCFFNTIDSFGTPPLSIQARSV
jgi:hypothetical protein